MKDKRFRNDHFVRAGKGSSDAEDMVEEVDGNEIVLKKVLTCKLSDGVHGMGLFALPSIVWPIFETLTRMKMRQAAAVGDDEDDDDEKPPNGLRNLFRFFLRF